jgi:hypothetical protein
MTATSWPEAVAPPLKSRLPFRLQGVLHSGLLRSIPDCWNTQRPQLAIRLRDVHAPHWSYFGGRFAGQCPGHSPPSVWSENLFPVNSGCATPQAHLCHSLHARERVGVRPHHELLEIADLLEVPLLRSLENPLPESPHVALYHRPVDAVPVAGVVQSLVPRSLGHFCHRSGGVQRLASVV